MEAVTSRIDEFKERLQTLYADIRNWLWGRDLRIEDVDIVVLEEKLGVYTLNGLEITTNDGTEIASITPAGIDIIGGEGQVRISGPYDDLMVTYFIDGGPEIEVDVSENGTPVGRRSRPLLSGIDEPGWYLVSDPRTGQMHQLDKETLLQIFRQVSDYEL